MLKIVKGKKIKDDIAVVKKKTAFEADVKLIKAAHQIVNDVKKYKDKALLKYTEKFDGIKFKAKDLEVKEFEIELAHAQTDEEIIEAIRLAIRNISRYHFNEVPKSWLTSASAKGKSKVGLRYSPINRVGVYVPGGRAQYPSTVLMNVIPAKVAGVDEIIMVVPPGPDGDINHVVLAAAYEVGVNKIFRIGGAQAIAALAYGTKTIPKVDKIVGPGNIFVTLAKKLVYGEVGIDKLAGPSDICVIADRKAQVKYICADLLSQLEHDPLASAMLITTSTSIAKKVNKEIKKQLESLAHRKIILKAMKNCRIYVVKDLKEAVNYANLIAPEHLELMVEKPYKLIEMIENAGAIFLGSYSPEPLGDYLAGPNHVLPTGGTARFSSPLCVDDFLKKSSIIHFSKNDLKKFKKEILLLANLEGLDAHARSVNCRF